METSSFDIEKKLNFFYENNKIPHLIFHGASPYEKEQIASQFIHKIYQNDVQQMKFNVLVVNCCGKGIKFIRDEIKTFAKLHMFQNHIPVSFKTILLLHADFITEDAQSALRRSIELFSYNTRFFIIVENKNKLLKPILSRFCEIYVGPTETTQLPPVDIQAISKCIGNRDLATLPTTALLETVNQLYENGFSSYHLLAYFENVSSTTSESLKEKKIYIRFLFYKLKSEYRCEKLFMLTLLDFFLFRSYEDLKNMCLI